jgi:predicted flavoprotein YhiN
LLIVFWFLVYSRAIAAGVPVSPTVILIMLNLYIGGGAAGYFAAIVAAERNPKLRHVILEASSKPMAKIKISGGGRCNVTHNCFDSALLVKNYPRGEKELLGPFKSKFQPKHMIAWLEDRGVKLHSESDGRMFPVSNTSTTIIDCFEREVKRLGIEVRTRCRVSSIGRLSGAPPMVGEVGNEVPGEVSGGYAVTVVDSSGPTRETEVLVANKLLLATGSFAASYGLARQLGHTVVPPVPSLFTFNCGKGRSDTVSDMDTGGAIRQGQLDLHPLLEGLAGTAFRRADLKLSIQLPAPDGGGKAPTRNFSGSGPLLITHWGLSGPAVLRLSAFAALPLHAAQYKAALTINWLSASAGPVVGLTSDGSEEEGQEVVGPEACGGFSRRAAQELLEGIKRVEPSKVLCTVTVGDVWEDCALHGGVAPREFGLSKKFWIQLVRLTLADRLQNTASRAAQRKVTAVDIRWGELTKAELASLATNLTEYKGLSVTGKGVFKEEFVSAGGIDCSEIDWRSMQSKRAEGVYFAGEMLNVDGVTGGFNFQNAWTTGWIAAQHMAQP